jgi:poly(A) polymerase Pap1
MNFDGIEIDMLFARLALKEIPDTMVMLSSYVGLIKKSLIRHVKEICYAINVKYPAYD